VIEKSQFCCTHPDGVIMYHHINETQDAVAVNAGIIIQGKNERSPGIENPRIYTAGKSEVGRIPDDPDKREPGL
jgi:hypothetical protein